MTGDLQRGGPANEPSRSEAIARTLALALAALLCAGQADLAPAATSRPATAETRQPPTAAQPSIEYSGAPRTGTTLHPFVMASEEGSGDKQREGDKAEANEKEVPLPPSSTPEQQLSPAQQYCSNVIDAASAAQLAQQTSKLQEAQKDLDERIAQLTSKTEVLKEWIKTRQEFTARATDSLVQIYSKMKPDAAAGQLALMDELVAAAIMSKLSPKVSSALLGEMEPGKAARLSAIIAGAGEITLKPERKADAQPQQ